MNKAAERLRELLSEHILGPRRYDASDLLDEALAEERRNARLDPEAMRRAFVTVGFVLGDGLTPEDGIAAVDALIVAYENARKEAVG